MPFTVGQYLTVNDLKSQEDAHTLGYGVVNGLKVVPVPASMDVQVETGKAYVADTLVEKGAVTDLTVSGADPTNPRKDIVVCNSAGALSIVAGTPEAALPSGNVGVYTLNPEPPSIPANSIILAEIWVPAGATEITGSEIYDKRVFTVDRLDMGRMPDMPINKVMVGQGVGNSPVEKDCPLEPVTETAGTFSFDETSALEQDMPTVSITARCEVGAIWIDMVNVTQNTTIKVYHKIDGTNFREISSHSWVTTDADGVLLEGFAAYRDIKVSLTCGGGGAGSVNVPYAIV